MNVRRCVANWIIFPLAVSVSIHFLFTFIYWVFVENKLDFWNPSRFSSRLFSTAAGNGSNLEGVVDDEPTKAYRPAIIEVPTEQNITRADYNVSSRKVHMAKEEIFSLDKTVSCNVSKGKWVYDETYPLYSTKCAFIDEGFDCYGNGRLDTSYMKWRWQPLDCGIPRFNGRRMLELIKGKRIIFVGDSLNRNQWESMVCLLMEAVKDRKKVLGRYAKRISKLKKNNKLFFPDYKCSVEFRVSHFLVQESKARLRKKRVESLRIDKIDSSSSGWKGADIVIFNTGHWWTHSKTNKGINYFQEGNNLYQKLNVKVAFKKALTTWARWVDDNMNPNRTSIFFRSFEPSHFRGGQWNSGGQCSQFTQPLEEMTNPIHDHNAITEEVINRMRTPVTILNITGLSDLRIDGHPSRYSVTAQNEDCSHWCLPGVPDTWNELLYHYLLKKTGKIF